MILKVNEDFRVMNDDCYFTVQKRRVLGSSGKAIKNPELVGTDVWENQTYHVTLSDAYISMINKSIALCDDFKQVINLLNDVKKQLNEQCRPV